MITRAGIQQTTGVKTPGAGVIVLVLVSLQVCGCSPYQDVSISDEVVVGEVGELSALEAREGDQVKLTTREGRVIAGTVVATTTEAISVAVNRDGIKETL